VLGGYIYGGYFDLRSLFGFARWDVAGGTWTAMAAQSTVVTSCSDFILGINGTELILICLAVNQTRHTIPYDIGSDTWGAERTPCPLDSYASSLCQSDDGFIYVISGETILANPDAGGDSLSGYKYEMATDTWTQIADLDVGFYSAGCDVGTDGKVYVIGGIRDSLYPSSFAGVVRVYDPGSDTWDTSRAAPPVPSTADPNAGVGFPVVAQLPDGKLLYGGGIPYPSATGDNGEFWIYDPATDAFTPTTASDTADPTLLDLGGMIVATDGNTVYAADSAWAVFGRFDYG